MNARVSTAAAEALDASFCTYLREIAASCARAAESTCPKTIEETGRLLQLAGKEVVVRAQKRSGGRSAC